MSRHKTGRKITDHERFPHFMRKVDILFSTKYAHRRTSIKLHIVGTENEPLQVTLEGANEDEFRSFLLTFRMFISPGEPVNISQMYKLAIRYFTEPERKEYVQEAYEMWKTPAQEFPENRSGWTTNDL